MNSRPNQELLKNIIQSRLKQAPREVKKFIPSIFSNEPNWLNLTTDQYFLLVFYKSSELSRIQNLIKQNLHPFPGFISDQHDVPSAFRFEKSRNIFIEGCTVNNAFSLSLGKDCSIVISNHKQIINTHQLGPQEYTIEVAYLVSFGDEINQGNCLDFVEGLIAYSINEWRSKSSDISASV